MPIQLTNLVNNRPLNTAVKKPINLYLGLAKEKVAQYDEGVQYADVAQTALNSLKRLDKRNPQYEEQISQYQNEIDSMTDEGHYEKYVQRVKKLGKEVTNNPYLKAMQEEYVHHNEYMTDLREGVKTGDYDANNVKLAIQQSNNTSQNPLEEDEFGNIKNKFSGVQMLKDPKIIKRIQELKKSMTASKDTGVLRKPDGTLAHILPDKYGIESIEAITPQQMDRIVRDMVEADHEVKNYLQWESDLEAKSILYDQNGQKKDINISDLMSKGIVNSEGLPIRKDYERNDDGSIKLDEKNRPTIVDVFNEAYQQRDEDGELEFNEDGSPKLSLYDENGQLRQDIAFAGIKQNIYESKVDKFSGFATNLAHRERSITAVTDEASVARRRKNDELDIARQNRKAEREEAITYIDEVFKQLNDPNNGFARLEDKGLNAIMKNADLAGSFITTATLNKTPEYINFVNKLKDIKLDETAIAPLMQLKEAYEDKKSVGFWESMRMGAMLSGAGIANTVTNEQAKLRVNEKDIKVFEAQKAKVIALYGADKVEGALSILEGMNNEEVEKTLEIFSKNSHILKAPGAAQKLSGGAGDNLRNIGNQAVLTVNVGGYTEESLKAELGDEKFNAFQEPDETTGKSQVAMNADGTYSMVIDTPFDFSSTKAVLYDGAYSSGKYFNPHTSQNRLNVEINKVATVNQIKEIKTKHEDVKEMVLSLSVGTEETKQEYVKELNEDLKLISTAPTEELKNYYIQQYNLKVEGLQKLNK